MRDRASSRFGSGTLATAPAAFAASERAVLACAGFGGANGAGNLGRTTTFAGYHEGVERDVTAFRFRGGRASAGLGTRG